MVSNIHSQNFLTASIITIGDEILIGQVVNTNAAYLSKQLFSVGIPVKKVITVSDNKTDILKEFKSSLTEHDVVVVTGGLGPTHDDITKACISQFYKSKLK